MPDAYENFAILQNAIADNPDCFNYGLHDLSSLNSAASLSPYSSSAESQGNKSVASPMSTSSSPLHNTNFITINATILGDPYLSIVEEPVEKFRFRYKSEMMGTHGSLVGANSTSTRKKHAPTVQLHNYPGKAIIRCTLVTSDEERRIPHAHRLVRREVNVDRDDPHHIEVSAENGYTASFHGMGIIHTAKKHIRDELVRKMRMEAIEKIKRKNINATLSFREDAQIKADADAYQKCMNLNSVALCFQAFIWDQNDIPTAITAPVYSHPINNLKSALTGELKICRIDKYTSSCEGGEEVFILVEKVGKKNIKIKFFELNEDDREIWSDYGRFSELDVHHQYAIVFRTPPYKDLNISTAKEVYIQLERPSDSDCSEPIKFTYKPSDRILGKKRPRMSYSDTSTELAQLISMRNNSSTVDMPAANDSREISKELNKMLSENVCTSSEFNEFIEKMDMNVYTQLLGNSEQNMLTTDGSSSRKQQDDISFARNVIIEAMKVIKSEPGNSRDRVKKLLKERCTYGDSPLHSALRYSQREIAEYILMLMGDIPECKSLVNIQNSSGKTPLHYAVLQNQPEIAKVLLMLGADPNMCDDHGFSPLHLAVKKPERGACVDALLSEKVTIEAHNDAGWTALQLAAEAGSFHAVRSLVQAGANVNNTDMSYGRTALHIAVEGGHIEIVEYLLKKTNIDVNKRNFSGNTALHSAVVNPSTKVKELCKLLMQHGADPHIQNHNRVSVSSEKKKNQSVDIKIEVDSDEETPEDSTGETSFDLASNKPDILQLLSGEGETLREEPQNFATKQEAIDESQRNWLSAEQKAELSVMLDKTKGWEKLARRLNFDYLLRTLEQNSSPSSLLLNYIHVRGDFSLEKLQEELTRVEEKEAATFLTEILSVD